MQASLILRISYEERQDRAGSAITDVTAVAKAASRSCTLGDGVALVALLISSNAGGIPSKKA